MPVVVVCGDVVMVVCGDVVVVVVVVMMECGGGGGGGVWFWRSLGRWGNNRQTRAALQQGRSVVEIEIQWIQCRHDADYSWGTHARPVYRRPAQTITTIPEGQR